MILDTALGIFLSAFIARLFGFDPTALWYAFGVAFALLPDIDVPLSYMSRILRSRGSGKGKFTHEHRDILHYPIFFALAAGVLFAVSDPALAWLFVLAICAHFVHDSIHIGWGIAWLWPFSEKSIKFFSDREGKWSWNIVQTWQKSDLRTVATEHGNENWLKETYLAPSPTLIFECAALICALAFACFVA